MILNGDGRPWRDPATGETLEELAAVRERAAYHWHAGHTVTDWRHVERVELVETSRSNVVASPDRGEGDPQGSDETTR